VSVQTAIYAYRLEVKIDTPCKLFAMSTPALTIAFF
jgi:hypothetical protein